MKKAEIAKRMARATKVTPAEAADRLDTVVRDILANLRHGKETALPGLGRFKPDAAGRLAFLRDLAKRHE